MPHVGSAFVITLGLAFAACAQPSLFTKDALRDVEDNFDLSAWKSSPKASAGHTIKVGGRIVQADRTGGDVLIVGVQLPIVEHPAYGPIDHSANDSGGSRRSPEDRTVAAHALHPYLEH